MKRVGSIICCEKCSRFEFHCHPERIEAAFRVKNPSIVFLGSMCDLFCDAAKGFLVTGGCGRFEGKYRTPAVFVQQWATFAPQHQYIVLTKSPQNIPPGWNDGVPNLWVGVSVTREHEQPDYKRAMTLLDRIKERRILCLEPILGPPVVVYSFAKFSWVIIGGLTGERKRERHSLDWVIRLVGDSQSGDVPVFLKRNLAPEVPLEYIMAHREYPPELAAVKGGSRDQDSETHLR